MVKSTGTFIVKNEKGWHARPCSRIVNLLKTYPDVAVFFKKTGCSSIPACGNSIFELMKLGLNHGDDVRYTLQGNDETEMHTLSENLLALNEQLAQEEESENIYGF